MFNRLPILTAAAVLATALAGPVFAQTSSSASNESMSHSSMSSNSGMKHDTMSPGSSMSPDTLAKPSQSQFRHEA